MPLADQLSLSCFQIKASYVPFYKSSLLFLACIDLDNDLSAEERVTRAHDLGVAALLGDSIYNFGELVREMDDTGMPSTDCSFHLCC